MRRSWTLPALVITILGLAAMSMWPASRSVRSGGARSPNRSIQALAAFQQARCRWMSVDVLPGLQQANRCVQSPPGSGRSGRDCKPPARWWDPGRTPAAPASRPCPDPRSASWPVRGCWPIASPLGERLRSRIRAGRQPHGPLPFWEEQKARANPLVPGCRLLESRRISTPSRVTRSRWESPPR